MPSTVDYLTQKKLLKPPHWLPKNVAYETIMGSVAYGVSSDTSDMDVYGFCFPTKELIFPHLSGEIHGFGRQIQRFEQYQQHHVKDESCDKQYDVSIYNIVKYFQLCMENNPNMVDSLFTPINCVLHSTQVGELVREKRKIFLHKGSYHKFLGYAHSQLHKMTSKNPEGKRKELREQFGFDVKYAYHLVRLSDEAEQILTTGDLDLQRAKEHMKAVRRGDISEKDIREWFSQREKTLEKMYAESKLQHTPNEEEIKTLLLECLEIHYGSLEKFNYTRPDSTTQALRQIKDIIEKLNLEGNSSVDS